MHIFLQKFSISCRKQQVAKLTPAEIVELSFLTALLEQQPADSRQLSKRFNTIMVFFKEIIQNVPIESALSCIALTNTREIIDTLSSVLKDSQLKPPFSLGLFINAALAISRLQGEPLHQTKNEQSLHLEDLFYVYAVAARRRAATSHHWESLVKQSEPLVNVEAKYMRNFLKWFPESISVTTQHRDLALSLRQMVQDAINSSTGRIIAISGVSINTFFEDSEVQQSIKSPSSLLRDGREQLKKFQTEMREELRQRSRGIKECSPSEESSTKAYNSRLLDYVNKLRSEDLHICNRLIFSFMEERVRIPIGDHKPVSYWKLLKLGLGIFRTKLSMKGIIQYVSVSKHVMSIADETTLEMASEGDSPEEMYAGKLKFLVSAGQGSEESSLTNPEYPIFSLERQLFQQWNDRKLNNQLALNQICTSWDEQFKTVPLGSVSPSHRSLIQFWLKFSLRIHKLREELSSHTSVGIVGLVNSGKSTLVQQLFRIKVTLN